MSSGSNYWGYYHGSLLHSQVCTCRFNFWMTDLNELQWLDWKTGHQYSSLSNNHQSNMPYQDGALLVKIWYRWLNVTHWGWVMHICISKMHIWVSKINIFGSNDDLLPGRCQTIICTNAGILSIGPLETNFSEIWIEINTFLLKKMHLKTSSAKWRLFCLGLNGLNHDICISICWQWRCHSLLFKCSV